MKISNFSTIIATFSISAILYCLKGWLKKMGIIIPNWIIGMIGFSGLAYVVIKEIVPPAHQVMIEPYTVHILSIEFALIVLSLIFRRYQWLQKEKDSLQKVSQSLARLDKEYILRLTALKDYIRQLKNSPPKFKLKTPKNLTDLEVNQSIRSQNRDNVNIHKNDILSKYKDLKVDIEHEHPVVFKGLSKNPTYEIAVHEINCLLNTFKRMQRSEE